MPADAPDNDDVLSQELRDERAARAFAEDRLASAHVQAERADEKAAVWRRRAEERAERIERLMVERDQSLWRRWMGKRSRRTRQATTTVADAAATRPGEKEPTAQAKEHAERRPEHPTVRSAYLVEDAGLESMAHSFDAVDIATCERALYDVDMVIVDVAAFAASSQKVRTTITQWLRLAGRAPLLAVGDVVAASKDQRDILAQANAVWTAEHPKPLSYSELATLGTAGSESGQASSQEVGERRDLLLHGAPWRMARNAADALGVALPGGEPLFTGLLLSNRPQLVGAAVKQFASQTYEHKELIVGLHGFGHDGSVVASEIASLELPFRVEVIEFPRTLPLGTCLNHAAEVSSGELLAKLDDDDYYAPNYVLDAVLAQQATQAAVVAKATYFTHLESSDETILNNPGSEECFVGGYPNGATLVFPRSTWLDIRFPARPRRVDSLFLRGVRATGGTVYSTNRYNYLLSRRQSGHTWKTSDDAFRVRSVHAFDGRNEALISV